MQNNKYDSEVQKITFLNDIRSYFGERKLNIWSPKLI
jgi:hypothetical protein